MKLFFHHNDNWDPSRYHYAAEQMMLTLFPGEKPEYPEEEPNTNIEDNCVVFTLTTGRAIALVSACVKRQGR
ncbi:MAG: coproporphyrinogen dehydrogenase HemZ, partial [Ruminiclostridium sp.]|nr:coproporphyrinogen dehydrogenase HemZ [Ruminiclostridium sp.]